MAIKIDNHVPLIMHNGLSTDRPKLKDMKKGQSYFLPSVTQLAMSTIRAEARKAKIKITCRGVVEKNVAGIRVWRLS